MVYREAVILGYAYLVTARSLGPHLADRGVAYRLTIRGRLIASGNIIRVAGRLG